MKTLVNMFCAFVMGLHMILSFALIGFVAETILATDAIEAATMAVLIGMGVSGVALLTIITGWIIKKVRALV